MEIRQGVNDELTVRQVYYYDFPTAVEEAPAPSPVAITGNAPNPFNPSTTIGFTLESAGRAELTVYNMAGQSVRTLVSADMAPGVHRAVWDGRDKNGMTVSAGVYFVRLTAADAVATHKMTLVK